MKTPLALWALPIFSDFRPVSATAPSVFYYKISPGRHSKSLFSRGSGRKQDIEKPGGTVRTDRAGMNVSHFRNPSLSETSATWAHRRRRNYRSLRKAPENAENTTSPPDRAVSVQSNVKSFIRRVSLSPQTRIPVTLVTFNFPRILPDKHISPTAEHKQKKTITLSQSPHHTLHSPANPDISMAAPRGPGGINGPSP